MQFNSDITSKNRILRAQLLRTNETACFLASAFSLVKRNIVRIQRQSSDLAQYFRISASLVKRILLRI